MCSRTRIRRAAYAAALGALLLAAALSSSCGARPGKAGRWRVELLPSIPGEDYAIGVSAPYCGMIGDTLVVAGGADFPTPLVEGGRKRLHSAIWTYHDGVWTRAGELPAPAAYGATLRLEGALLLAGGSVDGVPSDAAYLVRLHGGKALVEPCTPLPEPMEQCAWTADMVAGGSTTGAVYRADSLPGTGIRWTRIGEIPGRLVQPVMHGTPSRLFLWGGYDPVGLGLPVEGWTMDMSSSAWTAGPPPCGGGTLVGTSVAALADGRMVAVGGVDREVFGRALRNTEQERLPYLSQEPGAYRFRSGVWLFHPGTGRWTKVLDDGRCALAGAGVAAAPDGSVYVVGGELKPGVRTPRVLRLVPPKNVFL